jgi:hypothetical protein
MAGIELAERSHQTRDRLGGWGEDARLGQCSEMSPEGAKGYVNVTVRWARASRRVFPEGAEELDYGAVTTRDNPP